MLWEIFYIVWGCIPELTTTCEDMTNASGTYLGIAMGAIVGAVISWLVFRLAATRRIGLGQTITNTSHHPEPQ